MNKFIKIFLLVLIVLAIVLYWFMNDTKDMKSIVNVTENMNPIANDYVIIFNKKNSKIYISARAWGVSGNHTEIVLSNSPINKGHRAYSKNKCYIFYTSEIYYKKEKDTLLIYANENLVSKPIKFESPVDVIIKNLKTSE